MKQPMLGPILTAGLLAAATHAAPVPPAERIDVVSLHWAVRASVARSVAYLSARAADDPDGWIVPPQRSARIVGYTNRVLRFSEQATPLYEYETYTVYERRPGADSLSARTLQPVQKQRIKRVIDPLGGPKRLVHDPEGKITREERHPLYDQSGPDRWPHGAIGQNAMAVYALSCAGVAADAPAVAALTRGLVRLVDDYGAPDATWDLAWLTAAFARLPGDEAAATARSCASKLLDGQVLDGEGRGLWGPACINIPLLAAAYLHEQELAARIGKARLAMKENAGSRAREKDVDVADRELRGFQADMRRIAMLAMAFEQIDQPNVLLGDEIVPRVYMTGLPQYIFSQTAVDLESTALALFALREAADSGRLPAETWRPRLVNARGAPPAEKADAVLARTAHALAKLQGRDGQWHASNIHQPVNAFDKLGKMIPGLPVDATTFKPLPSPQTPLTTLQGYAAFVELGRVVGFEKALGRFRANFNAGLAAARTQAAGIPDARPGTGSGGRIAPYEACFYAQTACDAPGLLFQEQRDSWMRIAFTLVDRQRTNGVWHPQGGNVLILPTSLQARMETLPRRDATNRTAVLNRGAAYVHANWRRDAWTLSYLADGPILATCHALIFLAEGARPPALVATLPATAKPPRLPELALRNLATRTGISWRYATTPATLDSTALEAAPVLFLCNATNSLPSAAARRALAAYVRGGGIVIAQAEADASGRDFLGAVATALATGCDGGPARDIAAEERVLGEMAGRLGRPLMGVTRPDGTLAGLLLTLTDADTPAAAAFSTTEAGRLVGAVLRRNLDAHLLEPNYAHDLAGLGEPAAVHASALAILHGSARRDTGAVTGSLAPLDPPAPTNAPAATPTAPVQPVPPPPDAPRAPAADEVW